MGRHSSSSSRSRSRSRHRSRSRSHSHDRRRHGGDGDEGCRIHVSDLPGPSTCTNADLEKVFEKFGPLVEVWKTNNPPCFAFVVFKFKEDGEEAIRNMNGRYICGSRVRVSMALPRARDRGGRRPMFNSDARCYQCGQPGHFSRNCRNYEGAGRNRMAPSPRYRSAPRSRRYSSSSRSRSRSRSRDRRRRSSTDREEKRRSRDRSAERKRQDSEEPPERSDERGGGDADLNDDDVIAAQM